MRITIFILLTFIVYGKTNASTPDTIWVKEGDKKKMIESNGEWLFKDNLPDGHYCSYEDKGYVSVEVTIKNGKKEGVENRYFSDNTWSKYATVTWVNGKKNGLETHYNGNGTLKHLLTFKDGELNGLCEVNHSEGDKNYKGFYRNGYRDSIWTYYDTGNKFNDTSDYWIAKQYQYRNGKAFLISAWDKSGVQMITDGNGNLRDSNYFDTNTSYRNGMKDGKQLFTKPDGTVDVERIYKDDLLIKETIYYNDNKLSSVSEWAYPTPAKADTNTAWIDTYITDIFYHEITSNSTTVPDGHWVAYYADTTKIFEGDYINGKRTGFWNWYYSNGYQRITADFTKNVWQHYDLTGTPISNLSNEFLTALTSGSWFLNQKLDVATVTLMKQNTKKVTPRFVFHYDGKLEINSYHESGIDLGERMHSYSLHADTLIIIPGEHMIGAKSLKYRITSVADDKIVMQRIK